jgi:hypothetical protein
MQCIKQSSTLRVSAKHDKPMPRIVARFGRQERQIESFLQFRSLVQTIDYERKKQREHIADSLRALYEHITNN